MKGNLLFFALMAMGMFCACQAQMTVFNGTLGTAHNAVNETFNLTLAGGYEHTFVITGAGLAMRIRAGQYPTDTVYDFSGSNSVVIPACAFLPNVVYYVTVYLTDETVTSVDFLLEHSAIDVTLARGKSLTGSLTGMQSLRIFQITTPIYDLPVVEIHNLNGDNAINFYAFNTCLTQDTVLFNSYPSSHESGVRILRFPPYNAGTFYVLLNGANVIYNITVYSDDSEGTPFPVDGLTHDLNITTNPMIFTYINFDVPGSFGNLMSFDFTFQGGAELYVRKAHLPTLGLYDWKFASGEVVHIAPCDVNGGRYYIGVYTPGVEKQIIVSGSFNPVGLMNAGSNAFVVPTNGYPTYYSINFGTFDFAWLDVTAQIATIPANGSVDVVLYHDCLLAFGNGFDSNTAITSQSFVWHVANTTGKWLFAVTPRNGATLTGNLAITQEAPPNAGTSGHTLELSTTGAQGTDSQYYTGVETKPIIPATTGVDTTSTTSPSNTNSGSTEDTVGSTVAGTSSGEVLTGQSSESSVSGSGSTSGTNTSPSVSTTSQVPPVQTTGPTSTSGTQTQPEQDTATSAASAIISSIVLIAISSLAILL